MRGSRRVAPLSECSQKNQGITDSTDQTNSTDRSLTQTPDSPRARTNLAQRPRDASGTRRATRTRWVCCCQRPLRGSLRMERCRPRNDPWNLFHQSNPYPLGFARGCDKRPATSGRRLSRNSAMNPIPESSGCGFGREIAVLVDKELAVIEPANSPVLEPLLGDLLQDPVLLLPHHEMLSAVDGESQLVVVLD